LRSLELQYFVVHYCSFTLHEIPKVKLTKNLTFRLMPLYLKNRKKLNVSSMQLKFSTFFTSYWRKNHILDVCAIALKGWCQWSSIISRFRLTVNICYSNPANQTCRFVTLQKCKIKFRVFFSKLENFVRHSILSFFNSQENCRKSNA